MMIYINTKISYVARELKSDLWKVQADNIVNHCQQERDIMLSQLALIAADPHALPLLKHVEKGQAGVIAGDLLYLFSCAPVTVTVIPRVIPRQVVQSGKSRRLRNGSHLQGRFI